LANFKGFPENDAALASVADEPRRVEDRAFALLQEIVDGHNPKPLHNMGYSLGQNPERLAPFAEAMARRFVELNGPGARNIPNRDGQWFALRDAIAALPRTAFSSIANQIFDIVRRQPERDPMPALYVRAADAGMTTFPFYRDHFLGDANRGYLRILPVLAICRLGQADEETIAEMKRRFLDADDKAGDDRYKSALAVALMKLAQEAFLQQNAHTVPSRTRGWLDAVLAHKGETETGPNNCMPYEWSSSGYLGSVMAPSLKRQGNDWTT
jgi:hypothetical protein